MPGTNQPQHDIQGFWAQLNQIRTRIMNLELWQRVGALFAPTGVTQPTRVIGTAYRPNVARPTMVLAQFNLAALTGQADSITVNIGASSPPATGIATAYLTETGAAAQEFQAVTFLVPAGWFYKFVNNASTGTISVWSVTEWAL